MAENDSSGSDEFVDQVTRSIIEFITRITDKRTLESLDDYMKQQNTSLQQICKDPDKVSDILYFLFGEGANIMVQMMIKAAYKSFGFHVDEKSLSYKDLRAYLVRLNEMSKENK